MKFPTDQGTKNRIKIYSFIYDFIGEKGYSPTIREIGKATGLMSSATIHYHLSVLQSKGMITYQPKQPRTIRITPGYNKAAGE
jgi:repressor LexA